MKYQIRRASIVPECATDWESLAWRGVSPLAIDQFHPQSRHRPRTLAKLLHTHDALHVIFQVEDRFVKSVFTEYQDPVCQDSCVELFVQPKRDRGYFNFELNCGGTLMLWHIKDPTRIGDTFKKFTPIPPLLGKQVRIVSTMPKTIPAEIAEPLTWRLELSIPVSILEPYVGEIGDLAGQTWRGNFFKCASEISHPHWASWSAVGEHLNFHQPEKFGYLEFETES